MLKKRHWLLYLIVLFVLSFLLVSIWNLFASADEDAEDLDIEKLKELIELKRNNFWKKAMNPEDFENGSFEQHTQNHTLNHKKLFNNSLDLSNFTGENCRNSVQGKLLITDERGEFCVLLYEALKQNDVINLVTDLNFSFFRRLHLQEASIDFRRMLRSQSAQSEALQLRNL